MKKGILLAFVLAFSAMGTVVFAQEDVKKTEEVREVTINGHPGGKEKNVKATEEVIIRKKGSKDVSLTIEIKGDKITINGKPLAEFRDDNISINKRRMVIRGGDGFNFNFREGMGEAYPGFDNMQLWGDGDDGAEEKRAFLGVTSEDDEAGARITAVSKESAAAKAGLQENDVITKLGDKQIEGPDDLSEAVAAHKPGEEVKVTYKRGGKENTIKAKLGERVQRKVRSYRMTAPRTGRNYQGDERVFEMPEMNRQLEKMGGRMAELQGLRELQALDGRNFEYNNGNFFFHNGRPKLGLKIQDLEEGDGVKVTEAEEGTAAAKAGLKKDDVITEIGGKKIKNTDDAREELKPVEGKSSYNIKAKRNGTEMSFDVKVPKKIKTASL